MGNARFLCMSYNPCEGCGVCCQAFVVQKIQPMPKAAQVKFNAWKIKHLIPLSEKQVLALDIINANVVQHTYKVGSFYQTCNLYENGKCTDYENRPKMCSFFPSDEQSGSPYKIGCALIAEKFGKPKTIKAP